MGEPPVRSDPRTDQSGAHSFFTKAKASAADHWAELRASLKDWNWRTSLRDPARILAGAFGVALVASAVLILVMIAIAPGIPPGADLYAVNRPQALTFTDEKGAVVGVRGAMVGDRLK